MEDLVEDLQSLTLAEQPVQETERVSLGRLADESWSLVETDGATLRVDADGRFEADPHRLQQVFENLFRNAVEHGGEGVTVRVGTIDGNPTAGFFVADDGRGIPPDEREAVLESGYSSADGTGLGLAIVDGIVGAHDWDLSVTESADGGARFEVTGVDLASPA
jgi:signal transduction histidine kinase